MTNEGGLEVTPRQKFEKGLFVFWSVLLLPWLVFAPLSGMAFDGGDQWQVYLFVWATVSYPVVLLAAFLARRFRFAVFLPAINVLIFFIAGSSHH